MNEHIGALRAALPYVRRYQDEVFVIKLGGEMFSPDLLDQLAEQIAVLRLVGIRTIIVHGGGTQVDKLITQRGGKIVKVNGRRVTNKEALDALIMAVAGRLNQDLVSALLKHGLKPVGLTGLDATTVSASKRPPAEVLNRETGEKAMVDFGFVGDIKKVDKNLVAHLADEHYVPVLSCLAAGEDGKPLNVNADGFATSLAISLKAAKLIFLVNVPGLLRDMSDPSSLVSYADPSDIDEMIRSNSIVGGMLPKVDACVEAVRNGVARAHLIDGTQPDTLLIEVFTNSGIGTMIVGHREPIEDHEL